jgi:NodT family efflux transporter outer membrane factor (OMF) lipoprotein
MMRAAAVANGIVATLAAALLAAGCASFDGSAPRASLRSANELRAAQSLRAARLSEAAWPVVDWWKDFGDAQLDTLIAEALSASPTLGVAEARLRKAQAAAASARAALAPQVNANVAMTRERYSANGIIPPPFAGTWNWQNQATLDFSYELDFWGRNRAALQAALGEAKATEVDEFASRLMLSVAIAQAYVGLQRDYGQLDVAEATLEQRAKLLDLTGRRVSAGLDSRVQLKQAEAAVPETRGQIAKLREAIALSQNQLAALLGQGPDRGLAIARPQAKPRRQASALPTNVPADLIGRRPDVVAQRWRVESAALGIEVARDAFYPNVSLTAFAGFQSIGLPQFLTAASRIAGIGPALSLPIFNGGALRAGLSARHADYDAAVEQYNQALVDALRDVVDQLTSMRYLEEQRGEQRLGLERAAEAYDLAVLRYREGLGNYLQVLSAESQVLALKGLAADLDARDLALCVNLIRALGGGYPGVPS